MGEAFKLKASELWTEEYFRGVREEVPHQHVARLLDAARAELEELGTAWSSDLWIRISVEATTRAENAG